MLMAGGPKYVAGTSFFNSALVGQPVRWSGSVVKYYVDKGALNSSINNQQAKAMVDAAAALWSAVPTAGITLVDAGSLSEDVSGTMLWRATRCLQSRRMLRLRRPESHWGLCLTLMVR